MVSENKRSKSKIIDTPTKTIGQAIAHLQFVPSEENLQITKPAISQELCQTNLNKHVKKQHNLIEKLTKKVNTFQGYIIFSVS